MPMTMKKIGIFESILYILLSCLILTVLAVILSQPVAKVIFQIITLDSYGQFFGCFTQFQSCNTIALIATNDVIDKCS